MKTRIGTLNKKSYFTQQPIRIIEVYYEPINYNIL